MTLLDPPLLLKALRTADKVSGPAGESRLDLLIREVNADPALSARLLVSLNDIVDQLQSSKEWHALQALIGQTNLRSAKLGELLASRIAEGEVQDEAALWAAFGAVYLGATLKSRVLHALEPAKAMKPGQWFALMRDTQSIRSVESSLLNLATMPQLRSFDALELLRSFKRWANESGFRWNVTVSNFLKALPDEIEQEVSAKVAQSLGPSFALDKPDPRRDVVGHNLRPTESLYALPAIHSAMEKVIGDLEISRSRALEAA